MADVDGLIPIVPVVKNPDLGSEEVSKKFEEEVEREEKNCRRNSDVELIRQEEIEESLGGISVQEKLSTTIRQTNESKVHCDNHEKPEHVRGATENKRGRVAGDTSSKVKYKKKPALKQRKSHLN